jgi:hypothetical protein
VRIAILNASSSDELEPLLVATLSKTEGIELVERTEVERILHEHSLSKAGNLAEQLSIAALLHADGLLILGRETVDKSEIVTVRLTAVKPGVVIGSALFAMRKEEPESLAQDITSRFTPLLRKLNVKREQAIPISLLRLRCSVKSAETETLENQLAFLFTNRLIAQPEFFVLERWRLGDAAFEKALAHSDEGGFWNGAYLVDGEIETTGSSPCKVNVKVFARSPEGKEVKKFEAQGESDKLPELATQLASRLATLFAKQPAPTTAWVPEEESREYVREAEWALQGNLLPMARAALEAGGALGNREQKYYRLGANIYSELVNKVGNIDVLKNPELIRYAQLAIDSYEGFIAAPAPSKTDENKPKHWTQSFRENREYVGMDVIEAATNVLRSAYNQGLRTEPSLAEIRAHVRKLFTTLMSWKCQYVRRGVAPHETAAAAYTYWYETPDEALATCRLLLSVQPPEISVAHMGLLRCALLRCDLSGMINTYNPIRDVKNIPHLIDWNGKTPENCALLWRGFIASLLASPNLSEQLDGMLFQIVDEGATNEEHLRAALDKFWESREELLSKQRIGPVVVTLDAYLQRNVKPTPTNPSKGFDHADRLRWLLFFLEHSSCEDVTLLGLWAQDDFTEQEADAVCKALRAYRERVHGSSYLKRACEEIENKWLNRFPNIRPPAPEGTLRVTQFYPIPELLGSKASKWAVQIAQWNDKLWLCVTTANSAYKGALYGIELSDFKLCTSIDLPPSMPTQFKSYDYDTFYVGKDAFYYRAYGHVARYDRKKQAWTSITLPGDSGGWGWLGIIPEGEDFFISRSSNMSQDHVSGVWKWIAATGEFETISSNRRRPAQNRLDDCGGYCADIFRGPQGRLGVSAHDFSYLFNAQSAQWEPIPGVGGRGVNIASSWDYTLLLSSNWAVGLIEYPGGNPLEDKQRGENDGQGPKWFRGETPLMLEESKKSGVLPFASEHDYRVGYSLAYCDGKMWHCQPRNETPSRHHLLRCFDWANPDLSLPALPLEFEIPEAVQAFLPKRDTRYSVSAPPSYTHPLDELQIIATKKGLIFWAYNLPGFWFVPNDQLNAALESAPNTQHSLPASIP